MHGRCVERHELDDQVPGGRVVGGDIGAGLNGAGERGRQRHGVGKKSVIWKQVDRLLTYSLRTSIGSGTEEIDDRHCHRVKDHVLKYLTIQRFCLRYKSFTCDH